MRRHVHNQRIKSNWSFCRFPPEGYNPKIQSEGKPRHLHDHLLPLHGKCCLRRKGKKQGEKWQNQTKGSREESQEVYISFILYSSCALRSVVYVVLTPESTELADLAEKCILKVTSLAGRIPVV